ncbi:MAG: hypothetical protein ACK4IX_02885 [Candidatus Sericytochromatia bacterium]
MNKKKKIKERPNKRNLTYRDIIKIIEIILKAISFYKNLKILFQFFYKIYSYIKDFLCNEDSGNWLDWLNL